MSETIQKQPIDQELRQSYLDYAMSVIVSRAIPDARDGLKPVQRRILYGMAELGLRPAAKTMKAARIVGEVLGKFHPHGDMSVYDALVRLAQDFTLRYPLVTGQGNFGSIDGDPAAAMRYTEARLTPLAEELLADLDKETVNFIPNYDNTRTEPTVLPAAFPNLIVNGSLGIAVGMATNIPPHNLGEVVEAAQALIAEPKLTTRDLLKIIRGPDFPTGGVIYGGSTLARCYADGRGSVVVRGRASTEEGKRGQQQLVITEIPWQVNKSDLIKTFATLSLEKTIPEIKDVRDESTMAGIRIVLELREPAGERILEKLYRLTDLQRNYHFNLVSLEQGIQPKLCSIKDLLVQWLSHRQEVIVRRTRFDLARTKERVHLLEGFQKALDAIDVVIAIIRKAKDRSEAETNLRAKLKLSEQQANAILELPLRSLTSLERLKIKSELEEKRKLQRRLETILANQKEIDALIVAELQALQKKHGNVRRTEIRREELSAPARGEEVVEIKPVIITVNRKGLVRALPAETPLEKIIKDRDGLGEVFLTNTGARLWLISRLGRLYQVPTTRFIEGTKYPSASAGGTKYLESQITLDKSDAVSVVFQPTADATHLFIVTAQGVGKKLALADLSSPKKTGTQLISLKDDVVVGVLSYRDGTGAFTLFTQQGLSLSFRDTLPVQGRSARGVRVMRLATGDSVCGLGQHGRALVVVGFSSGAWKIFPTAELKLQQRGGLGIKAFELKERLGAIVLATTAERGAIVLAANQKLIRLELAKVKPQQRTHQPQQLTEPIEQALII